MTDEPKKVTALTELLAPALGDKLYGVDVSDTTDGPAGSSKQLRNELQLAIAGHMAEGRLTLVSGEPVSDSDVVDGNSIYWAPFNGDRMRIYDGSKWRVYTFGELELALSGLTSGDNYDVFAHADAGTPELELGAAWTSDTVRDEALSQQDGVYVKDDDKSRLYLGTFRATDTDATTDSGLPAQATNVSPKRFLWNNYNRRRRSLTARETAVSWAYTTLAWRVANNNSSNVCEFVFGLNEDPVMVIASSFSSQTADGNYRVTGIGLDSLTALAVGCLNTSGATANFLPMPAFFNRLVGLGYHYTSWLELSEAAGITTWYGDIGVPSFWQAGITAHIWA